MRRGGVARGWAGQGDGEPCREVGVEGAIDRVKRLAPRLFSRFGVAGVGSRDVGSTFPFRVGRFSPSLIRLLCNASVSQELFTPPVGLTLVIRPNAKRYLLDLVHLTRCYLQK